MVVYDCELSSVRQKPVDAPVCISAIELAARMSVADCLFDGGPIDQSLYATTLSVDTPDDLPNWHRPIS